MANICQHLAGNSGNLPGTSALASLIDKQFKAGHIRDLKDFLEEISTFSTLVLLEQTHGVSLESFKQLRFRRSSGHHRTSVQMLDGIYEPKLLFLREVLAVADKARQQKILAGLTRLKSYFIHTAASRSDIREIRSTISEPYNGSLTNSEMNDIANTVRYMLKPNNDDLSSRGVYPLHLVPESNKSSPFITDTRVRSFKRNQLPAYNVKHILQYKGMLKLATYDEFFRNVYGVTSGGYRYVDPPKPIEDGPIGTINIIHEPGFKNRVVASPTLLAYSLGYPLNESLKRILRSRNTQGVFSHSEACEELFRHLKSSGGTKIYNCIDSSNFTDRLPYQLQSQILSVLLDLGYITEFDKLVMDYFAKAKYEFQGDLITYGVGQPQGFLPSFNLASFTNEVILAYSAIKAGSAKPTYVSLNRLPGKVIGDDIVIYDESTAAHYRHYLTSLGVEINQAKSLKSDRLIEFTSKLISPYGIFLKKKLKGSYPNWESKKEAIKYYGLEGASEFIKLDETELLNIYLPQPYGLGLGESGPVPDQLKPYYDEAVEIARKRGLIGEVLSKVPSPPPSEDDVRRQYQKLDLLPDIELIDYRPRMDKHENVSKPADLGLKPFVRLILEEFIQTLREAEDTSHPDDNVMETVSRVLNPDDPMSELFENFCSQMTSPLQQTLIETSRSRSMRLIRKEELSGVIPVETRRLDEPGL